MAIRAFPFFNPLTDQDEATASVDFETDSQIQRTIAYHSRMGDKRRVVEGNGIVCYR